MTELFGATQPRTKALGSRRTMRLGILAATMGIAIGSPTAQAQICVGDCGGDGEVRIDEVIASVNIGLGLLPPANCTATDADGDGVLSINELIQAVRNGLVGCPMATAAQAFIVATDFQTGAFGTISLDAPRDVVPVDSSRLLNSDAVPRVFGDLVYVVNRFGGDNIQVLDPQRGFETLSQCSTGNGSNPQDIVVVNDEKAYVTRGSERTLLIVRPLPRADCSNFVLGEIDLSEFADADGIPEMDQMALVDGVLYVLLQRLENFSPTGPGKIIAIDAATDTLIGESTLSGENPFGSNKGIIVHDGALLVAQVGAFGVLDGGIERVDLATGAAQGFFVTEEALGGDINDFVVIDDHLAYAIVGAADFSTQLVAFDPSSGLRTGIVLDGADFLSDIEVNDRGELWVLDRGINRPGARVFRANDATEITSAPINLGLPPFQVIFLRNTL